MNGLIVFVNAKKSDVEVVSRVSEIIGIPAEERSLEFRREDQADIGVLLVLVQVVDFPRIENHDIATQAGGFDAVLFDTGHGAPFGLAGIRSRHAGLYRLLYFAGDILNAD
jgi:hypothetical protein